jgi:hypothetical protein
VPSVAGRRRLVLLLALVGATLIGAVATYVIVDLAGPQPPVCDSSDVRSPDPRCPILPTPKGPWETNLPPEPDAGQASIPDPDRPPPGTPANPRPLNPAHQPGQAPQSVVPEGPPAPDERDGAA